MENENDDMFFQQGFGIGPFQMINEIGKGQFGKVFLGIHEKTKEKVAIKQIPKSGKQNIQKVYDEINIQKKLFHPYLCKMYSVIQNNDYLFIVTEYCGGGEIFKKMVEEIEHFEEAQACKIFSQILSGLEYMHNNYIAHCDVKLENMLFDEYGDAKLTDFGLSRSFAGDISFTSTGGSPMYASPEVVKGVEFKGRNADIWSMGVCLYLMIVGDFPFQGKDLRELVRNILKSNFTVPDYVSPLFKDLIYKILEKNPDNRLTIQQIKEHPWMHIIDFNFMKSPGVSINTDILPIDVDVIEEIAGTNESLIGKIISDIITNKHNNSTILYYLKIEIKKRNKEISVSDIRPSSEIFLEYINDKKNKLSYYGNDINKIIEEIKKSILDNLKKKQSKIREDIKNSFQIESPKSKDIPLNNNIIKDNNPNNNNHKNNPVAKKKINKKLNKLRSKTFGKFDFLEFIKKEEEEEKKRKEEEEKKKKMEEEKMKEKNKEIPKINKFEILKKYIGPLLFVHDIIDNIITKAVKSSVSKELKLKFIPVNNSTLNVFATKPSLIKIDDIEGNDTNSTTIVSSPKINKFRKFTDFTINTIEEFEFTSTTTKNTEKTFSFGFYNPKNKNNKKVVKNVKTLTIDENDEKTNRNKEIKKLNGVSKNKNLNETDNKNNNNNNNRSKRFEKKKLLTHLQRNKSDNLCNILNNKFAKGIKEEKNKKENKEKNDNKQKKKEKKENKKNKRSLSEIKKDINKIKDEEINKEIEKRKRRNSEKIKNRMTINTEECEKKDEKVKKNSEKKSINGEDNIDKKRLFSNRIKRKTNLDENLNINKILSEKNNINSTKTKDKISSLSKIKEFTKNHKNMNLSQVNFYNKKKLSNVLNSNSKKNSIKSQTIQTMENSSLKQTKTSNRTLLIRRNKNKTDRSKNNNNINEDYNQNSIKKTHMRTETVKIGENSNKKSGIKSTIFHKSSQRVVIGQNGRNQNNKNLTKKNTDDSIVKRKINFPEKDKDKDKGKKNIEFKTIKGSYSIDKRNLTKKIGIKINGNKVTNKNDSNQELNEIITKKNENVIKKIIGDIIGNNNITISSLKEQIRFSCKIFLDKKKLIFNLKLISNGKNRSVINGELEYGDKKLFQKLFSTLKEKLE